VQIITKKTAIEGVSICTSPQFADERGSFSRWYCFESLKQLTKGLSIRQVNRSCNHLVGTVRGLHYQLSEQPEYKIVRCIQGQAMDFVVDLRRGSKTFLQHINIVLSNELNNAIVIPPGCAHGFQTMQKDTELMYFHTGDYSAEHEYGARFDDPLLNIMLPMPITQLSDRDKNFPFLSKYFEGLEL